MSHALESLAGVAELSDIHDKVMNGRRLASGLGGTSTVDLNNIPTDLIERVEVITGGASAVYGSEAVAGVVNFVLKQNFEGVRVRAQAGQSKYGDNSRPLASVCTSFWLNSSTPKTSIVSRSNGPIR